MPESFHARFPVSAIYLYSDLHLFFAPSPFVDSAYGRPESSPLSLLLRRFVFRMAEASAKRVTGDEPQGTMGRVSFPPSFARTFSSKERRLGTRQIPSAVDRFARYQKPLVHRAVAT